MGCSVTLAKRSSYQIPLFFRFLLPPAGRCDQIDSVFSVGVGVGVGVGDCADCRGVDVGGVDVGAVCSCVGGGSGGCVAGGDGAFCVGVVYWLMCCWCGEWCC